MGKAELGIKRICPSCGARYYDLNKMPPVCPGCSTQYDPEALLKSRRVRIPVDDNIRDLEAKSSRKSKKALIDDEETLDETVMDDEEASELEEYEEDLQELGGEDVDIVEGDDDLPRGRVPADDDDLDDDDLTETLPDDIDDDLADDLVVDDDDLDDDDLADIDTDADEDEH